MKAENMQVVNFRVRPGVRGDIKRAAAADGLSMSTLLRRIVVPQVEEMLEDERTENSTK